MFCLLRLKCGFAIPSSMLMICQCWRKKKNNKKTTKSFRLWGTALMISSRMLDGIIHRLILIIRRLLHRRPLESAQIRMWVACRFLFYIFIYDHFSSSQQMMLVMKTIPTRSREWPDKIIRSWTKLESILSVATVEKMVDTTPTSNLPVR